MSFVASNRFSFRLTVYLAPSIFPINSVPAEVTPHHDAATTMPLLMLGMVYSWTCASLAFLHTQRLEFQLKKLKCWSCLNRASSSIACKLQTSILVACFQKMDFVWPLFNKRQICVVQYCIGLPVVL
ncbi:hypothetical protein GDO81_026198 [Engystomops pustulosus]|uniref:Uncharacterized protein n=1 Tax=Engystomops pustulosus TaxID=76066 RepID=A0AAV6YIL3_ENGPU|nr:hypothetical protein GDO81_026198 [Engystomops pustulosus]